MVGITSEDSSFKYLLNVSPIMATKLYNEEDLIELIKAIKFAYPEYDVQSVHQEISMKISKTDTFEFLSSVKVEDIASVWDKALESESPYRKKASEIIRSISPVNDEVIKFYSVGDGSVKKLAGSYSIAAAAEAKRKSDSSDLIEGNRYVHCFLNVPADLSGTKPHQALINFNSIANEDERCDSGGAQSDRDIVKIQTAAEIPGYGPTPLLLYNKDRSCKTFIHPSVDHSGSAEDGYNSIRQQIEANGISGSLNGGGKKGYFYARVSTSDGISIISVDISTGMAPAQPW